MSPTSLPPLLWSWYVDTLWNYTPDGWVASTASTFRIFALLLILPGLLLTLLDVTSYVIARTLGDTSAFTSDKPPAPRIVVGDADTEPEPCTPPLDEESEGALRLAGVGVFSPASSRPPSPTVSRKPLPREEPVREEDGEADAEGTEGEGGGAEEASGGSASEGGFALLERAESFEDAGALRLRTGARRAEEA